MSTALALQAESNATAPVPGGAPWISPAGYPASPLVLAAVAGAVFALVLFSLVTIGAPYEFVSLFVLQLAAGNRRVLERARDLAMLVGPHARLLP